MPSNLLECRRGRERANAHLPLTHPHSIKVNGGAAMQSIDAPEVWRPVVGYEGRYEVSSHGRVRRCARSYIRNDGQPQRIGEKVLPGTEIPSGHLRTQLRDGTSAKSFLVHRLVLEAFVGPCPEGMEACHANDIPTDNQISNLRWGTRSENARDRVRNGRDRFASRSHCSNGHEYTEENTYVRPGFPDYRYCRACSRDAQKRARGKKHISDFIALIEGERP